MQGRRTFGVESLISVTKFTSVFAERSASSNARMLRKQEGETKETAIKSSESLPENGQVGKHERTWAASSEDHAREARWKQSLNEAINSIALCRCT